MRTILVLVLVSIIKYISFCCSPDAKILILSGSHGTEEGKEGRIVDGGMMIEYLLQETQP